MNEPKPSGNIVELVEMKHPRTDSSLGESGTKTNFSNNKSTTKRSTFQETQHTNWYVTLSHNYRNLFQSKLPKNGFQPITAKINGPKTNHHQL